MKLLLLLLIASYTSISFAYELKLTQFDQEKLAELVERLPTSVRFRNVESLSDPAKGRRVLSEFPIEEQGFRFICVSNYFNHSPHASSASCKVIIDEHHPGVDMNYDEFKVSLKDVLISQALFQHISYGKPHKEFRSEGRDSGISYEGKEELIFRYYFKCRPELCVLRFSNVLI